MIKSRIEKIYYSERYKMHYVDLDVFPNGGSRGCLKIGATVWGMCELEEEIRYIEEGKRKFFYGYVEKRRNQLWFVGLANIETDEQFQKYKSERLI